MAQNRTMQAKNDKARQMSMLASKQASLGEFMLNRNYDAKYANVPRNADSVESFRDAIQKYEHKCGRQTVCDAWDF